MKFLPIPYVPLSPLPFLSTFLILYLQASANAEYERKDKLMEDLTKEQKYLLLSMYKEVLNRQPALSMEKSNYFEDSNVVQELILLHAGTRLGKHLPVFEGEWGWYIGRGSLGSRALRCP